MLTEDNISVLNKTKGKLPSLPFLLIKESILGKDYSLSVAFISKIQSKKINNEYRKKNNPTNILSFPLSKKEGEILICPDVVKTETKKFDKNFGADCIIGPFDFFFILTYSACCNLD